MSKKSVSLGTMVGSGESFEAGGKTYTVKPLALKYVDEFINDGLSLGTQLYNLANPETRQKLEKWIPRLVFDGDKALSLNDLMENDWTIADLRNLMLKACDLSG